MRDLHEINTALADMETRLNELAVSLKIEEKRAVLAEIDKKMAEPNFWNDPDSAQKTVGGRKGVTAILEPYDAFLKNYRDSRELFDLAKEEDDKETLEEAGEMIMALPQELEKIEVMSLLGNPHDHEDCFFSIHTGAGGSDACEWAEMLLRMYTRFFEEKGWTAEVLSMVEGEEAGIKGVDLQVKGQYSYGMLKGEMGVHRLVRMSPFSGKRETSFAAVDVFPDFQEEINIEIKDEDLRIDTYRAGGKGGQHVNKTDSAVRITHLPTNIVVAVQNERSQHTNKAKAMEILKSRLYAYEENQRQKEVDAHHAQKAENAWGSQIRNYVMQPYTLVKDVRTDCQTGNVVGVLDGGIQQFIDAYLRWLSKTRG